MPNIWTGKGNPYTRTEVRERLLKTLAARNAVIVAGAGTGISAKFIEKGGADLIIVYNSGRYRMAGHGSTAGLMAYDDANRVAMEIGEFEVLPVVNEIPVICGVHGSDPRRRMWHHLTKVKEMGFSGVNNFPTHCIIDGHFRHILEETGMGFDKEVEMIAVASRMELFSIVYVSNKEEALKMLDAGADVIIVHVGTTVGGSVGVVQASVSMDETVERINTITDAVHAQNKSVICLAHGGPLNTPSDVTYIMNTCNVQGFVGASSLERMAVEESLLNLTKEFKSIKYKPG